MRLYNGCPDSSLKLKWDTEDKLHRKLKKIDPSITVTYFPVEQGFMIFKNHLQINNELYTTLIVALNRAIEYAIANSNEMEL